MNAHMIARADYAGKVENLYEVRLECYSGYTKNWSACWRDIYAETEQDILEWAASEIEEYMTWCKENDVDNKMVFHSYRKIESLPYPDEYPTDEEIAYEMKLEGCYIAD